MINFITVVWTLGMELLGRSVTPFPSTYNYLSRETAQFIVENRSFETELFYSQQILNVMDEIGLAIYPLYANPLFKKMI